MTTTLKDMSVKSIKSYPFLLCGIFATGWAGFFNDKLPHEVLYPWGVLLLFTAGLRCIQLGWKKQSPHTDGRRIKIAIAEVWCASVSVLAVYFMVTKLWSTFHGHPPFHWIEIFVMTYFAWMFFMLFFKLTRILFGLLSSWHSPEQSLFITPKR